jgi:uncharacterized RDD family membrane protein YckC
MNTITGVGNRISITWRLGSMLLDHFIMGFVIGLPLIIISLIFKSDDLFVTSPIESIAFYMMMLIYFNKDFFNARSIAKRIMGFQIIDRETGQPANELKCFLRNITIPLWPLEVLISLISPTRRLGDLIANTSVEQVARQDATLIFQEIKKTKLTRLTLWTFLIGCIYMGMLWYVMGRLTSL